MNILDAIKAMFGIKTQPQVQASPVVPITTPTATPEELRRAAMIKAIQSGFENWGNPPAATLAATFADEAMKYPDVYKDNNRFLIPAISVLESGAGSNLTKRKDVAPGHRAYNITNWGINLPAGYYKPSSVENVIERTTSGIGSRTGAYKKFRESGGLHDLAPAYAPVSDNPDSGGDIYAKRLQEVLDVFNKAYKAP